LLIKVCGITRRDDAEAAVEAGAGALGFVFWPNSPRFVDPYRARAIVAALPAFVTTVGVFVNQTPEYINEVAALVRLGVVQLHGEEPVDELARIARPVLKAFPVAGSVEPAGVDVWPAAVTLLLDVHDTEKRGGTGRTIDWDVAVRIASRRRSILAGGLTPDNVADAIARVRPFGLDVSSGVERSPGIKDHGRVRAFFEAVHGNGNAARS
jgi:phosphoribosylanthranilate isomerase